MTWVKKIPAPHHCTFPDSNGGTQFGRGSVWKCDGCDKVYTWYGWVFGWRTEEEAAALFPDEPEKKRWWRL